MDVDRVQDAEIGKGKKGKKDHQKGKGKDARKNKRDQKREKGDDKGKSKGKDQQGKGVATCYACGKPRHLAKDCWRNHVRQVASDQAHWFSRGASVTTQQHAKV